MTTSQLSPPSKPLRRIVFSTEARIAHRGVAARASSWGWCWIVASDGTQALFVNAGVPERYRKASPTSKTSRPPDPAKPVKVPTAPHVQLRPTYSVVRCEYCGYCETSLIHPIADAATIATRRGVCGSCMEDSCALHALELQMDWGIDLGWRRPQIGVMQRNFHEDESGLSLTTSDALRMRNMRAKRESCSKHM